MITSLQIDEFASVVQGWRTLLTAEQDDVISEALDRYLAKQAECDALGVDANDERISNPVAWLVASAGLIRFEVLRRRTTERKMLNDYRGMCLQDRRMNGRPMQVESIVPDADSNLEIDRSSQISACEEALNSLTSDEQQVARLCFIEGLMPAEVGRLMSSSRSTTKSRRDRVRQKLMSDLTLRHLVSGNTTRPTTSCQ